MSAPHPTSSPANRLKLHNPTTPSSAAARAARDSIISSSAKGWSPLQIQKRDGSSSPLKTSPNLGSSDPTSPRRTSNSFKHVTKKSLVANSPFKNSNTVQGAQALGMDVPTGNRREVVHEKRVSRQLGQTPPPATGVATTPKAAIGLGISATAASKPRKSSGSAIAGTRKVSNEKLKASYHSALGGEKKLPGSPSISERRVSGERNTTNGKENDSPDLRNGASKEVSSKSSGSTGLKSSKEGNYVSKSPFTNTRRIPSSEIKLNSPSLSPAPSPKTIPSSPSPRRVSPAYRRVSPAGNKQSIRTSPSPSPTPSPPKFFSHASILSGTKNATSSPLRPSDTPSKSAMTPSKRLLGPRTVDSPTKGSKTVTFQSVPDVKEFETEMNSTDGSMDGSFEIDTEGGEGEKEWIDDILAGEDQDDDELDGINGGIGNLRMGDIVPATPDDEEMEEGDNGESTTADFVNTLIEEGLFTPNIDHTPQVPLHTTFDLNGEPIEGDYGIPDNGPEGIPYGRTHHSERQRPELSHSLPPLESVSPFEQPNLPTLSGDNMLLNGNAAQPSLPITSKSPTKPISHQIGGLHDPFLTVQTVTDLYRSSAETTKERKEGDIPLGRTSHLERNLAAKSLASNGIGLGMPGSPAKRSDDYKELQRDTEDKEDLQSESGSEMDSGSDDDERLFGVTPRKKKDDEEEQKKFWEGETPKKNEQGDKRSSKLDFSGFSLPFINMTSPFFRQTPSIEPQPHIPLQSQPQVYGQGRKPSAETENSDTGHSNTSQSDDDRPLTPPPNLSELEEKRTREGSPHRIPSFEFEEIKLTNEEDNVLIRKATITRNTVSPLKPTYFQMPFVVNSPSKPTTTQEPVEVRNINTDEKQQQSQPVKVRQRISREMIRETIDKKYADGSLSKRPHSVIGYSASATTTSTSFEKNETKEDKRSSMMVRGYTTSVAPPTLSRDKDLPSPPMSSTPLLKSSTDVPTSTDHDRRRVSPIEASSGLDKIIGVANQGQGKSIGDYGPTANITQLKNVQFQKPIVQTPERSNSKSSHYITPSRASSMNTTRTTTPSRGQSMDESRLSGALNASGSGHGNGNRNVSGLSAISERFDQGGSRRSRRSMSLGELNINEPVKVKKQPRLTLGLTQEDKESISAQMETEISQIDGERNYKVKQRQVLGASYGGNTMSHSTAGDIDGGKAWRQLRRPSDINEHAAELRALKSREVSIGKATGTIFVKVLGMESLGIPIPQQPTYVCVTLDNGIDYIRTPYTLMVDGARINQEFALVEHPNFEFSLSLDVRRDPHIIRALQDQAALQVPVPIRQPSTSHVKTASGGGIRNLFSSPRKAKGSAAPTPIPQSRPVPILQHPQTPSIAQYLATANSSTIAKTHVAFKPIAKQCEAKILEIRYPMFAMFKGEPDRSREGQSNLHPNTPRKQVAKITLQMFRLPPLPGVRAEDLPQCIDECLRGMRHHAWHECEYHEGILTQEGGDCTHPRRRMFKLIGGNLVAYNEITKKEVTTINLKHATSMLDLNPDPNKLSPQSRLTKVDDEGMFGVRPRSFKVIFKDGESIVFSADKDAEKSSWMETLNGLIGKIPSNPLWAEVLSMRMKENKEKQAGRSASRSHISEKSHDSQLSNVSHNSHISQQSGHSSQSNTSGRQPSRSHSGERRHKRAPSSQAHHHAQQRMRESSQAMSKTKSAPARTVSREMRNVSGDVLAGRKGEGIV